MIFWHRNHQLGYTFCGALPLLEGRSEVIFDEGSGEPSLLEGLRGHEFTRYEREPDTFLDKIVIMDKSAVAYHTPETKEQSKQLVKKGYPGTIKCKTQASRVKQMVLAFHNSKGLIYTNLVPRAQGDHGESRLHHGSPQKIFEGRLGWKGRRWWRRG